MIDNMAGVSGKKLAYQVLHYLTPLSTILCFTIAKAVAACFLHQPSKNAHATSRRYFAAALLIAVASTSVLQGILYLVQTTQYELPPSQDVIVYLLLSCFVYGSLSVGLLDKKAVIWYPYLGAWMTALALEVPCGVLQALVESPNDWSTVLRITLHALRVVLLLVLSVFGSFVALVDRRSTSPTQDQDENQPLLAHRHLPKPPGEENYGTRNSSPEGHDNDGGENEDDEDIDSESEEPETDRKLKAQQRKRLEESGNWLNYLKDFKIFIPMLWPSRDRFVQACLAVVGLILLAERFLNVLAPRQVGIITDELERHAGTGVMPWRAVGIWMALSWLKSQAGLALVKSMAELPVQQFAFRSIGKGAFKHIMNLSMDFHNDKNSGELIRAIEQGQNLQGLLEFMCFQVGPMFTDLIIAFVYVYTLFDIYMSIILVVIGLAYVWIGAKTTSWSIKQRRSFNAAWRNESKVQNEAINNWQTVSHFNRGAYECERYSETIDEYNRAEWAYYLAYYIGGSLQSLIMLLGRLTATALAAYRVAQGQAPIGSFVTLTLYWSSIESPLAQVSWSIRRVSQMLTDSERLLQLMLTKPTVADLPGAKNIVINKGEVVFHNVDFAYDDRRLILKQISFKAMPGQTVALVGETGGGKSTILKLLYRYYDVKSGSISIDGQNIQSVTLDSLRYSFGMVPQDPSLFNISLMENLRYARLDATDEEIQEACKAAAIHDKIESFPDKYKSTVGERGVKLSGGELQRVSIARAILRQPKIVLLDEATSMIDAETESLIQEALKKLMAGRTSFVIAHRLSTIQHADLILVINDGRIVEHGTHDELMRKKGKYVALWSKQLSKDVKDVGDALAVNDDELPLIALNDATAEIDRNDSGGIPRL